jgi:release factor glutamine methyltransferase
VCREPILIPRPETEEWCATLSARLRERSRTSSLTIVDVCTGSGCVALALAKALDGARVVGVDDNPAAVALARENAARNGIERIEFVCADAVDFLRAQTPRSVAVVCGNPPYVSTDEWPTLQPEVRLWEDPHALVADDAGTALLRRLIEAAASVLRPPDAGATGPRLALEIGGAKQAKSLRAAARHAGFDASEVWLDYRKRARVFAAV